LAHVDAAKRDASISPFLRIVQASMTEPSRGAIFLNDQRR
jgi:hypothetical protein